MTGNTALLSPLHHWLAESFESVVTSRGVPFFTVRWHRVSGSQYGPLADNVTAGVQMAQDRDADVEEFARWAVEMCRRDAVGAAVRAERGTLDLTRDMLVGGTGRQVLGHLTVVGSTLFVCMFTSAAKQDLEDAVNPEDCGNAAVETIRTVTRTLTMLGRQVDPEYRTLQYFTDASRPVRSRPQGVKLVETFKYCHAQLGMLGRHWNVREMADEEVISMLFNQAAAERIASVGRLTNAKVGYFRAGLLPEAPEHNTPFTHEPRVIHVDDGRGGRVEVRNAHFLVPKEGAGAKLSEVLRRVIEAGDAALDDPRRQIGWDALAERLSADLGLVARGTKVRHAATPVPLAALNAPAQALKHMLGPRYLTAWRTGLLPYRFTLPLELAGKSDELKAHRIDPDDAHRLMFQVTCPIPDGIDLTDKEWEKAERYLTPGFWKAGRPPSGDRRPLHGQRWTHDGREYAINLSPGGTYRLESRAQELAVDATGRAVGWPRKARDRAAVSHHLTVNACVAARAVGAALRDLACRIEAGREELAITAAPADGVLERERERTRMRLEQQIVDAERLCKGARRERYWFAAEDDDAARDAAAEDEDRYRAEADSLREQLRALEDAPPPPSAAAGSGDITVAISTLEELAAALLSLVDPVGTAPPEVAKAFGRATRGTFRIVPHTEHARCEMTVFLQTSDGHVVRHQVSCAVPVSHRGGTAVHASPAIAQAYLWDGTPLTEIGQRWGIDGSGKSNSFIVHQLKRWLAAPDATTPDRCVGSPDLRRALLGASPIAQRAVYALITDRTDELVEEGVDPAYLDIIRATYLSGTANWGESWVRGSLALPRRIMDHIVSLPDPHGGAPVTDIMNALILEYDDVVSWTGRRTHSGSQRPAVLVRNWQRNDRLPLDQRIISLRACPHQDCPGRGPGRSARRKTTCVALLTHVLWVPELPGGLLCPACRRAPDGPARYPDEYLQRWRKGNPKDGEHRAHSYQ